MVEEHIPTPEMLSALVADAIVFWARI